MLVSVNSRGTLTLPAELRKKLDIKDGDYLEISVKNGTIVITPVEVVPKKQALTAKGKAKEKEADKDIKEGRVKTFNNAQELIKDLND